MEELRVKFIRAQKSDTNSRKADWKQEVIRLEIVQRPAVLSSEIIGLIEDFSTCSSVEMQLQYIKECYHPELEDETKKSYLEIFCKIYFLTPWKHPVKNYLSKLLDHETPFGEDIKTYLQSEIVHALQPCQYVIEISHSELHEIIGNVGALLENFKCGTSAFQESLENILQGFSYTLRWYLRDLRGSNVSPATKNELCTSVHNLIKIVIHAVQLFSGTMNFDGFIQEMMSNVSYVLNPFPSVEIPIDTKANAGILTAQFFKGIKEDPFRERIKGVVNIPKLCIVFGVITHFDVAYLKTYPDALEKIIEFIEPAMKSSTHDSSVALFIARAVSQLSKRLEALPLNDSTDKVADACQDYAIRSLDHDLDAVKNTSKEIIQNLVTVGLKHIPRIMGGMFALINNESTDKRHKSTIIACICQVAGAKYVCREIPNVQKLLLDSLEDANSHNTNSGTVLCYEKLMTSRLNNGVNHNIFFDEFITRILEKFNETKEDAVELRKSLAKLLHRAIKKCSYIVDLLLAEGSLPIELSMSCLGAAKKSGVLNDRVSTTTEWKSIMPFKDIKGAMVSNEDQIRMAAFELIIEVHRLTEMFTQEEFNCILYFLKHNINSEVPAIRSQIIGHMRNCLFRIENGLNFFNRNPEDNRVQYYTAFIHDLASFCFDNFFPGANFGRRTVSLKILLQLCDSIKGCSETLSQQLWNVQRFNIILSLCNDTYESNKGDAVTLLKYCPEKIMHNRDVNIKVVQQMIQSCKPTATLSGAYYLEFLVFVHMDIENKEQLNLIDDENLGQSKSLPVLKAVLWLEKMLLNSFQIASTSLMRAACQCPMYGELFAMRLLLSKIEFIRGDPCTNHWKSFLTRFIPFCNQLTEVAAPIVNNSSPEGHLPNDFSSMQNYANGVSDEEVLGAVTPQMVLLCAWRTVKEVSLLLGDISFKTPLITSRPDCIDTGYISVNQILSIGTHFTTLLSETKHRGAFEQAYVGFTRLSSRLWSCDALELHSLPMRWLQALMKIIAGETITTDGLDMSVEKLCATRRSAGVPFLMQALVTAELQVGKSSALKFCMENLIKIARGGQGCESRTHALNILRAFYRCSELSQMISPYISEGFIVAIQAYDADSWAERNSATLLFSSLMLRVFGVQRHKDTDQMNIRNKMTGRNFFQRYPELYDFFFNILVESQKISQKGSRCRKLHSLLLLLGRLYPSSWEEIDSNLSLLKFVPLISGCTANPELKTRQLAAKIIPIIIQPDKVLPRITDLISIVFESKHLNEMSTPTKVHKIKSNSFHGALLQILYLTRSLGVGDVSKEEQQSVLTKEWTTIQTHIFQRGFAHIPVIVTTFCDILLEMYLRISEVVYQDGLSAVIEDIYKADYDVPGLGHDIMMRKYGIYHFLVAFTSKTIKIGAYFEMLSSLNYGYDFQESILNMLVLVTDGEKMKRLRSELEITDLEVSICQNILERWDNNTKTIVQVHAIQNSDVLGRYLIDVVAKNLYHQCTWKAYLLISNSPTFIKQFMSFNGLSGYESLLKLADRNSGQIREAIYSCLDNCFKFEFSEKKSLDLSFVINMVTPDNSDSMKMIGITILKDISNFCTYKYSPNFISHFFWSLLVLLREDESEIRYAVAALTMKIFNDIHGKRESLNVLASKATDQLFVALTAVLTKHNYTREEKKTVYQEILRLDKEFLEVSNETNAAIDDANRCFDKNETNLFGESKFVQDECLKWVSKLSETS